MRRASIGFHTIQFAIVILIGVGLGVWLLTATRYQYYSGDTGPISRDDSWTRTHQVRRCHDQPTGHAVLKIVPSSASLSPAGPEQVTHLPLSVQELDRINQVRQGRHVPIVDRWGHELVKVCRWETV